MGPKNLLMFCLLIFLAPLNGGFAMTYGHPRKTAEGEYIFYHWGADPWMKEMKNECQFTPERFHFFMNQKGAFGPGLYLADTPVGSCGYAGRAGGKLGSTGVALVEVHMNHLPHNIKSSGWWRCTQKDGVTFHDFTGEGMELADHQWVLRSIRSNQPAYNTYKNSADCIFECSDRGKESKTFLEGKLLAAMEAAELYEILDVANCGYFADVPLHLRTIIAKKVFLENLCHILEKFQYQYDLLRDFGKSLNVDERRITGALIREFSEVEKGIKAAIALEIKNTLDEAATAPDFVQALQKFQGGYWAKKMQSMLPPFLKGMKTKIVVALIRDTLAEGIDHNFFNLPGANTALFNQMNKDLELKKHPLFPQILDKALAMAKDLKELKDVKLPNHFMAFLFRKGAIKEIKKIHKKRFVDFKAVSRTSAAGSIEGK